jgi:hypothetical protein
LEAEAETWLPVREGTAASCAVGPEARYHSRPIGAPVLEADDRVWPDREADGRSERGTSRGSPVHGRHNGRKHDRVHALSGETHQNLGGRK